MGIEIFSQQASVLELKTRSNQQRYQNGIEQIRDRTKEFFYGVALIIPDQIMTPEGQIARPVVYINELNYKIPTSNLIAIPELIVFEDRILTDWLIDSVPSLREDAANPEVLWVFPGGGGRYMQQLLAQRGIIPNNFLQTEARRVLGGKGQALACNVSVPVDTETKARVSKATKIMFVDDTISTGMTIDSVMQTLKAVYGLDTQNVTVLVQALGLPRTKELFLSLLTSEWNIFAAIFYAGETMRPRLLTTGSIIRGVE